jgi:hypothetical protein
MFRMMAHTYPTGVGIISPRKRDALSGQLAKAAARGHADLPVVARKYVSEGCDDNLRRLDVGDGWRWGGWVLMCVVMVLFWSAVITAIVLAIRYLLAIR